MSRDVVNVLVFEERFMIVLCVRSFAQLFVYLFFVEDQYVTKMSDTRLFPSST